MKKTLPFLLTLALLLTACKASKTVALADLLLPQKEQTWQLVARQGHPLNRTKAAPSLVINPDAGVATGFAYCNEYTFKLKLVPAGSQPDGDYYTIHLGLWGSGNLGCPESDMNAEQRYLSLLAKASLLRITATTLTLFHRDKEILHFELK